MVRPLQQVAGVPWVGLVASGGPGEWAVRFVSPFTCRRGNRFLPWPAPATVFGSLRLSWRTFAAPQVGDVELDLSADPIVVAAIEGSSLVQRVPLKSRPELVEVTVGGFVGTVRYAADGRVDRAAVSSLLRLAPFCGVGAYTTRGFGAVRAAG